MASASDLQRVPIRGVLIFTSLYMLLAVVGAITQRNAEFVYYIVVMVILIAVVGLIHFRTPMTRGLLWGFSLWGLSHMAGGLTPLPAGWPYHGEHAVLYSWWIILENLKYDQVVHAYGFGLTTVLCWHLLRSGLRRHEGVELRPTFGILTLCAAAGTGFGALNEVIEFVAVLTMPETNVGGYRNTGWDLVANLVGAALAVILIRFRAKSTG